MPPGDADSVCLRTASRVALTKDIVGVFVDRTSVGGEGRIPKTKDCV